MNNIKLMGNIANDLEIQETEMGLSYLKFCIAVKKEFKKDETNFINCIAWRKTAEIIQKYFKKGNKILIDGELNIENYKDKEGNKRSYAQVNINKFYFVEKAGDLKDKKTKEEIEDDIDSEFPF